MKGCKTCEAIARDLERGDRHTSWRMFIRGPARMEHESASIAAGRRFHAIEHLDLVVAENAAIEVVYSPSGECWAMLPVVPESSVN